MDKYTLKKAIFMGLCEKLCNSLPGRVDAQKGLDWFGRCKFNLLFYLQLQILGFPAGAIPSSPDGLFPWEIPVL